MTTIPLAQRVSELLDDLQLLGAATGRLEPVPPAHGGTILDAFLRHCGFDVGAVWLREDAGPGLRLAAKSDAWLAPDLLDADAGVSGRLPSILDPEPQVIVPLRSGREALGLVALARHVGVATDDERALARAAATLLSNVMTAQRLTHEMREGDFQLKYRLWELESLYDIGLSIAGTLNVEELADEILFRMISLTNARRAALFLREGVRFVLYRSFGDVRGEFLESEVAERIVNQGQPIRFQENAECAFPGCSAFVAVPISGNRGIIGVLAAADREMRDGSVGTFEENELRLLSLFANQVAIALENARLHREALEKQAMERELELAATIQRDILPKAIPEVAGVDLAALSRPARQVGGDYHAVIEQDGVVTMVVADVAGKSIPAALLVSALHAALQLLLAEGRDLGDIATELNRHIHNWSAENKFVTMFLASIDPEHETLRYVNAGHNPAYVVGAEQLEPVRSHGLPVGILGQSRYVTQTRRFAPGSALVIYSDGITEAENAAGEEFENERLEAVLRENRGATAAALRDAISEAVDAFVAGAPQKDDQTLVIARVSE